MFYSAVAAYFGFNELTHPVHLTHIAALSTLGIGGALFAVGLAHFVAPHKAFLLSIPLLLYFHLQMFVDGAIFQELDQNMWKFQAAMIVVSGLILFLSYRGYKNKQRSNAR